MDLLLEVLLELLLKLLLLLLLLLLLYVPYQVDIGDAKWPLYNYVVSTCRAAEAAATAAAAAAPAVTLAAAPAADSWIHIFIMNHICYFDVKVSTIATLRAKVRSLSSKFELRIRRLLQSKAQGRSAFCRWRL